MSEREFLRKKLESIRSEITHDSPPRDRNIELIRDLLVITASLQIEEPQPQQVIQKQDIAPPGSADPIGRRRGGFDPAMAPIVIKSVSTAAGNVGKAISELKHPRFKFAKTLLTEAVSDLDHILDTYFDDDSGD